MSAGLSTGPQKMQVGDIALSSVLDAVGLLASCDKAYPDVAIERWNPFRPVYPELFSGNDWRLPVACTVIRTAGTTVLVDAGVGPPGGWSWDGEREGLLPGGLVAAGIEPANVDTVFFTHLHVDHVGWLADPSVFAAARIVLSA